MGIVTMIAQLVLSLSILVVLHELGHFIPAKLFKTRVEKFYLFFDPWFSLVKKKIGETTYGVGWLPLGGYVKISGMIDESMDKEQMKQPPQPWEFRSKPAWQRLIIMLGGVTVNFILGFLIFGLILFAYGEEYLPTQNASYGIAVDSLGLEMGLRGGDRILKIGEEPFDKFESSAVRQAIVIDDITSLEIEREGERKTIQVDPKFVSLLSSHSYKNFWLLDARRPFVVASVDKKGPASDGGILAGDQIVGINGISTPFYQDFGQEIRDKTAQDITLQIVRNNAEVEIDLTTTEAAKIGVVAQPAQHFFEFERQDYSLGQAIPAGIGDGWNFLVVQFKAFGQMFKGKIKASESLGGFGTITNLFPKTWNWKSFWYVTAILSLILGFMNLLPIPALDGGHVMFLLIEAATGKKFSDKFMEYATLVGFAIVLGLVLYANGLDVLRAIKG